MKQQSVKRKIAIVTLMCMAISSPAAFAQEIISKDKSDIKIPSSINDLASITTQEKEVSPEKLTEILNDIKQRFVIYDKEATFKYSVNFENEINMYNLSWDSENYNTYIKYGEDKNVYWYYSYKKDENVTDANIKIKNLPVYDKKGAMVVAEDFIQKSLPKDFKNFKLKINTGTLNSNIYNFEFDYYKNNIPVDGILATALVDAMTGKIVNFSTSLNNSIKYEDTSGIISSAQAKEAYKNQLGIKVIYQSDYDYQNDKINNIKLIYVPNYGREYAIDAKSGKRINLYKEMYNTTFAEGGSNDKATAESASKPWLTEQEISEIESKADLASLNQAKEKVLSYAIEVLKKDMKVNSAQLYESKLNTSSGYIWSINYIGENNESNANVQVDAKTLELIGFNSYDYNYNYSENQITSSQIEKSRIKAGKILDKYSKINKEKLIIDEMNFEDQTDTKSPYIYVRYNRVENGIEFPENYIDMTYDVSNDRVVSYNQNWYSIKLPENKKIISPETIYNKIFKENQLTLKYKIGYSNTSQIQSKLIYEVNQSDYLKPLIFDAITGKRIISDQSYTHMPEEYKDIDKSKYPKEIQTLLLLGIGFEGAELNPQKIIKQDEYLYLIAQTFEYSPIPLYKISDLTEAEKNNIEQQLRLRGVLLKDEKMVNQEITREEAIKYLVRALGHGEIASHTEIFKLNINDSKNVSEKYTGYVAIGDALSIIIKDEQNNFNPQSKIKRDEALKMVYNYLK